MGYPKRIVSRLLIFNILTILCVEIISLLLKNASYPYRQLVLYAWIFVVLTWMAIWGFGSGKNWIKNTMLTIVSAGFTVLFIDVVFFVIIHLTAIKQNRQYLHPFESYNIKDSTLGYKLRPNSNLLSEQTFNDTVVYRFRSTTDQYGRRINPYDTAKRRNKFALFFGCSYTFGQGVNDSETIPARFSYFLPDYHSYNYAASGYGPQQLLISLQNSSIRQQIKEKDGVALYIYISDHVNRAIGDMFISNVIDWGENMPYFYQKGDTLIRKGTFWTGRWFRSRLYKILERSSTLSYFKFNYPFYYTDNDYRFVAKMIEEARNQYVVHFKNNKFYVVIYPGEKTEIIPYLKALNIKVLDYSKLFNPHIKEYSFEPFDPHPRPKADSFLSRKLADDLMKMEQNAALPE